MYLSRLEAEGFRSLSRVSVSLDRDVTVLVGENNGGKSGVIDALRLVTEPIDGRRVMYLDRDDVFRGPGTGQVVLRATYTGSAEDLAPYQHALVPELDRVLFTLRYSPPGAGQLRGQVEWTAGNGADPSDPQPRARDRLRHVYLPPLRDAARDLGSTVGSRIHVILDSLLTGPEPALDAAGHPIDEDSLLEFMRGHFRAAENHPVVTAAAGRITAPLTRLTAGAYEQAAGLGFPATSVQALARALRVRMADAGLLPRDIAESGMGYANLLFIATVLAQLDAAQDADLTLLLVEEPEAHLHPPLQALLLDYLRDAAAASRLAPRPGRWRGYLQVVITSHAPSLAAAADVTDLVVLQRQAVQSPAAAVPARPVAACSQDPVPADDDCARYQTTAVNIAALGLADADRRKLNRYLNATRSAMLFSPRLVLVEGIAEALLLPCMAAVMFPADSAERARFTGTALVPIDGVDFAPYLRVLLIADGTGRVGQRVAVITDADAQNPQQTGAARIAELTAMITGLGASGHAAVFTAPTTLEPELLTAGNDAAIWAAWRAQQPLAWRSVKAAVDASDPGGRAAVFAARLRDARLRKGDFAQDFLTTTQEPGSAPLRIPTYLEDALRWVTAPPATDAAS